MELYEKIRFFRRAKHLNQEQMAERLNISPVAYSNIETGKSSISTERLEQIAKLLEVDLLDLLSLGEKNVIILHGDTTNSPLNSFLQNVTFSEKAEKLSSELEKAQLLIEQKDREIFLLKQQVEDLRTMLNLIKK